ncbi:MaoC family dehydratase [Kitasatospora kifunensis]|uniref:Acyl dehydratase n=1 Tax=Kitasatospora kifunensis TaxID=58351 RepID=A0A7W7R8T2_KITKI|nr:MaoC family dehydratase [Kitasatospora kifunensis]MBB4927409.1 acyl dehydratase [Kitasatospora kifunensis]
MRYVEDYEQGRTYELGTYKVTEQEIVDFGRRFDPQPYHVDAELGEDSLFQGLVASGWHTCGMFMRLYVDTLLGGAAVEGSPGVDELRWLKPVRPGDVLTGRLTIVGVTASMTRPGCSTLHKRGELTDAQGQPVMRLTLYSMFRHRPRD